MVIREVELPTVNSRRKRPTRIVDIETGEELVSADLTEAAAKRFIKYYQVHGIYGKVA
jgi:hypothetical protein